MVDTNEQVIAEAQQRGETLTERELVALIERYHRTEGPGVDRDLVEAYDTAVADEEIAPFAEGELQETLDRHLGDSDTWVDAETYYPVGDGRVSVFPAEWHDALGDSTDLRAYVDVIEEAMADEDTGTESPYGGLGTGVPEGLLLDAVAAIGGLDRETAKDRLERRRNDGELVQDADQHPDARVYLSEETDDMRDDWLSS